jgi:hypothetical protein
MEPRGKFGACSRGWAFWIGHHLSHRCREHRRVTWPAFDPPAFCTGSEDTRETRLRYPQEPEARYRDQRMPLPGFTIDPSR